MFRSGAAAQIKKWDCPNGAAENCAGAPDDTVIFYVTRYGEGAVPTNTDMPELVGGSSMIMSTAHGIAGGGGTYSTGDGFGGSICYTSEHYTGLNTVRDSVTFTKCSCTITANSWTNGCKQFTTYENCMTGTSGSTSGVLAHHLQGQKSCEG